MESIVLLALAAAVFPTLLACVAIMITRPEPRPLLFAFYAGGLLTSLTAGFVVLKLFGDGDQVLGSTKSSPEPAVSIVAGVLALLLARLMTSTFTSGRVDRWRGKRSTGPSWAERHLDRASPKIAFVVGVAINLPGPWYLLALGELAGGGYSNAQQVGLIVLFNVIMFLLLEVPLVGYLLRPEATPQRVGALSRWLDANGLRVTGWLVGIFGLGLIAEGIVSLA